MTNKSTEQYDHLLERLQTSEVRRHRLMELAASLSSQTALDTLLSLLLAECRNLILADAGSIYVRDKASPGGKLSDTLRFKISQNDSIDVSHASEFSVSIDDCSVAGYVALTGQLQNIPDVYSLPTSAPYTYDEDWNTKFNYPVTSMLTVPLKNLSGDVVGVLQLLNKKSAHSHTLPVIDTDQSEKCTFTPDDEELVCSIGALAAVSIERVQLYCEIEDIFEGYLQSSIAAIDERDRITSGHSRRVMDYALKFAEAVNADTDGLFKDMFFSDAQKKQFRFAALLHDIGKIGVPEELLRKQTRLSPPHMDALTTRVDYIRLLLKHYPGEKVCSWNSEQELDDDLSFVERISRADFLPEFDAVKLKALHEKTFLCANGVTKNFFTDYEWEALSVRRGNLSVGERELIKLHAHATQRILSGIPWTHDLRAIPEIAAHHHEKIDGSGYPNGLSGDQICFESKALAVIDIFEALTARERPYKPKMPEAMAIHILRAEAEAGHLDTDIVEFFVTRTLNVPTKPDNDV
jgi:HD-GYP domain-containing protein (c-di-GMP phosphodiesterase class II)